MFIYASSNVILLLTILVTKKTQLQQTLVKLKEFSHFQFPIKVKKNIQQSQ